MSTQTQPSASGLRPAPVEPGVDAQEERSIREAAEAACRRIAPLWPLDSFVAVNPFAGMTDLRFADAASLLGQTAGARVTPSRAEQQRALAEGRILREDLDEALKRVPGPAQAPRDASGLLARLSATQAVPAPEVCPTMASVASSVTGRAYERVLQSHFSSWCSAYFDHGQAIWKSPWRHLPPYRAWRSEGLLDRSLELSGLPGWRAHLRALPDSAEDLWQYAIEKLGLPTEALTLYFHRLLMGCAGWSSYARYRGFQSELEGRGDPTQRELLAIQLAYECLLLESLASTAAPARWRAASGRYSTAAAKGHDSLGGWMDEVLQVAREVAFQRRLADKLAASPPLAAATERPGAQLAFCIDVRSEALRRSIESEAPDYATLGFAGFFGFPLEWVTLGAERGAAHCPVLMPPAHRVCETSHDPALPRRRAQQAGARSAWDAFKKSAVGCFGFVESLGLASAGALLASSLPRAAGALRARQDETHPLDLTPRGESERESGLALETQVERAEAMLRGMSLSQGFGRLVVLVGHGSQSVNNPHAAGLDCGACGGHTGAPNARVAAHVLNDASVRSALQERGIEVPPDTFFLAGEHNTTTDAVRLFDLDGVPTGHREDVERLKRTLERASQHARLLRPGAAKDASPAQLQSEVQQRAADWSQVRPEWGLAGCASFIAAPRERTRHVELDGRSFLHNYTWREDAEFKVLESIMTAPMVVASWISLQYYASTVDNAHFGCGNKVLHNVVGGLGVLEGAEGDLRSGLSMQSLHDGQQWVHEPVRLSVYIEAPIEAMNGVLSRNPGVRTLLDNRWIHLLQLDAQGQVAARYAGDLKWETLGHSQDARGAA